jgi:signal transduction histidine kinase
VRSMPGLGLSSMRERVQLIEGDFSIRSQPGQGTVIKVCVPLARNDP